MTDADKKKRKAEYEERKAAKCKKIDDFFENVPSVVLPPTPNELLILLPTVLPIPYTVTNLIGEYIIWTEESIVRQGGDGPSCVCSLIGKDLYRFTNTRHMSTFTIIINIKSGRIFANSSRYTQVGSRPVEFQSMVDVVKKYPMEPPSPNKQAIFRPLHALVVAHKKGHEETRNLLDLILTMFRHLVSVGVLVDYTDLMKDLLRTWNKLSYTKENTKDNYTTKELRRNVDEYYKTMMQLLDCNK